jgi:DNA replication protein DnaC
MRDFSLSAADDFYELLCDRVGKPGRSLVLTSNGYPADWYALFPNAVVSESVLDRVINTSHHLHMAGKSYRPNRRPGRAKTQR